MRHNLKHFDMYKNLQDRRAKAITAGNTVQKEIYRALKRGDRATAASQIEQLYYLFDVVEIVNEAEALLGKNNQVAPLKVEPTVPTGNIVAQFGWQL